MASTDWKVQRITRNRSGAYVLLNAVKAGTLVTVKARYGAGAPFLCLSSTCLSNGVGNGCVHVQFVRDCVNTDDAEEVAAHEQARFQLGAMPDDPPAYLDDDDAPDVPPRDQDG